MPATELNRFTLPNGLRVVLAPDPTSPVVGVSVHYDVGFRSEPEGRTGFAHLFEHLMFQGSESLEKLAHFRHVQSSGGTFNGSTHPDYTDYFMVLPSAGLERALFLEADRMRAPRITDENLRNQVDEVAVAVVRVGEGPVEHRRQQDPGEAAVGPVQDDEPDLLLDDVDLVAQVLVGDPGRPHPVGLEEQRALEARGGEHHEVVGV
ncbi:insulinase family protein, partial [Actinophytocola sp.]|uniref:M16 family metallopeptidase n=1 Tax=Actinophytocola sp. TaxID=1872138 RepID=UPI0025BC95F1